MMSSALSSSSERVKCALRLHEDAAQLVRSPQVMDEAFSNHVLDSLQSIMRFDCAAIVRWDPSERTHSSVASSGYPVAAVRSLEQVPHTASDSRQGREGRLLRLADIPESDREGRIFSDVIEPLHFSDGISHCLTIGGQCVGALHMSTTRADTIDDEGIALLRLLARDLATLADPFRAMFPCSAGATADAFAWEIDTDRVVRLSAGARPDLLIPSGAPCRQLLDRDGRNVSAVIAVEREILRVKVSRRGPWTLCEHRQIAAPYGLTFRELEVLCELAQGQTNRQIAQILFTSEKTVMSHVAHIFDKLRTPNRAGAAAVAAKIGLV